MKDLNGIKGITDELRLEADNVYKALESNKMMRRNNKRKMLLFYCIFKASVRLKSKERDPIYFANLVGMARGDISGAFSLFRGSNKKDEPSISIDPQDLVPEYCTKFGLDGETIKDIEDFCREIVKKDPSLLESFPGTVAAGAVKYYFTIHSISVSEDEFLKTFALSEATVKTMCKRVGEIYNRP